MSHPDAAVTDCFFAPQALRENVEAHIKQLIRWVTDGAQHNNRHVHLHSTQHCAVLRAGHCLARHAHLTLVAAAAAARRAAARAPHSKLRLMQAQVRDLCYDARNMPALAAIRDELDATEARLQQTMDEVHVTALFGCCCCRAAAAKLCV